MIEMEEKRNTKNSTYKFLWALIHDKEDRLKRDMEQLPNLSVARREWEVRNNGKIFTGDQ